MLKRCACLRDTARVKYNAIRFEFGVAKAGDQLHRVEIFPPVFVPEGFLGGGMGLDAGRTACTRFAQARSQLGSQPHSSTASSWGWPGPALHSSAAPRSPPGASSAAETVVPATRRRKKWRWPPKWRRAKTSFHPPRGRPAARRSTQRQLDRMGGRLENP